MVYEKHDFIGFSAESQRVRSNLEQSYAAWLDTRREADALDVSMYWATKDGTDCNDGLNLGATVAWDTSKPFVGGAEKKLFPVNLRLKAGLVQQPVQIAASAI